MKTKRTLPRGLYGITGEKFAGGKSNIGCVKEMILGGIKTIQYREKDKSIKEKIEEIREIRALCREANVCFIVNDHVDIALLVGADGVHVGQDDMSVEDIRTIVGKDMIIGLSTHSPTQAREALEVGADYIGVGPIFPTTTKDTPHVGVEYLDYINRHLNIPHVAIGGIKMENIHEIMARNPYCISLVSEVVGAFNISGIVREINSKF